jgi:hypothetical protein
MEKALKIINELKKRRIIKDYAIGGGIAVIYYVEPILTYDLDIFFLPKEEGILDILSPLYSFLKRKGYKEDKEHMIIEGIPVQFLPAHNQLIKQAFKNVFETKYKGTKTRVIKPEYLIAIMVQTFRPKDRERIIKMLDEAEIDRTLLERILKKYKLYSKFGKFMKTYYGE